MKVSEVELSYRSRVKAADRPFIQSSHDAYDIFRSGWEPGKMELFEAFKVLLLNRANRVLGMLNVSSGGITGTVADPRLIFAAALKALACSLILCHNHPSGNLTPSKADEELTHKIKMGGSFLDIKVLDHLIITADGYYSFADEGML